MYDILTVYHGGTEIIQNPQVNVGRLNLDFGVGFYVTDIYSQAKDWARRIADVRACMPILNVYHLHQRDFISNCRSLIFDTYNKEWLEFVTQSRLGNKPWEGYDYIEGGVADDRVVNTIRLYMGGYISAEDALSRLKYFKPANQICLLNQELTDRYLTYVESKNITDHE
ncbi:MAG: DUF3990 domain-containing protein [Muribaculaceae bacterium]|nr:DUF3990 domain-containing protein [Muribaculaceae bacterium]